ncbi:MAG: ribokinase [Clostridiales bacterium]|jgi:ribokinase|nr:ribokinase [Clostridiales bacterium]
MKILNFGSLNLDYVYSVDHFAAPGETIKCADLKTFCGGKGLNQSIALARAGAAVFHAGFIGANGAVLKNTLTADGVDTSLVRDTDGPDGHAIIQVNSAGENNIIVYGGANRALTPEFINEAADALCEGDIVLMQNETNLTDEIARRGAERGAKIALNPSPIDSWLMENFPFHLVSYFILNEIEGAALTKETEPDRITSRLLSRFPNAAIILTLGERGAIYRDKAQRVYQPAYPARVVDTTAAGDTFAGFFLACVSNGQTAAVSLSLAAAAAAMAVALKGAADSIPNIRAVLDEHWKL